jgi:hypothetical protein
MSAIELPVISAKIENNSPWSITLNPGDFVGKKKQIDVVTTGQNIRIVVDKEKWDQLKK